MASEKWLALLFALLLITACDSEGAGEIPPSVATESESDGIPETDTVMTNSPETTGSLPETEPTAASETELLASETAETEAPSAPAYAEVHEYFIDAEVHELLDFTYHEEYQNYAICDFAIAPNGNLLLLTMSQSVTEFTPEGKLVGQYVYDFASMGLTAYRMTCDEAGNFYFADGRNDVIIKADREQILHVSAVGPEAGLYALTLTEAMYAREEDVLEFLNYNENFEFCIYTVDVSGETAVCTNGPVLGRSLGGGIRAVVSMVMTEEGDRTPEFRLNLFPKDGSEEKYLFRSTHEHCTAVFGLGLYGLTGENTPGDTVIGYVREWVLSPETGRENTLETLVKITRGVGITAASEKMEQSGNPTASYGGETYILERYENGIRVLPLGALCSERAWTEDIRFHTVIE